MDEFVNNEHVIEESEQLTEDINMLDDDVDILDELDKLFDEMDYLMSPERVELMTHKSSWFFDTKFKNLFKGSKREVKIEPKIDMWNPFIFTETGRNGQQLSGLIHPETGLLMTNLDGSGNATALMRDKVTAKIRSDFKGLSREIKRDPSMYKSLFQIAKEVKEATIGDAPKIMSEISSRIAQLPHNPLPSYNRRCVYQGDLITHKKDTLKDTLVTERMPIENPMNYLSMDVSHIDKFMSVFFEDVHKETFSWYLGAALLNKDIDDQTISRALVLITPNGGKGKTTLMTSLFKGLFPSGLINFNASFDKVVAMNNRFSANKIEDKRIVYFNEATWGFDQNGENFHNFNGLDMGAIRSLWGDGILEAEGKYTQMETRESKGLQIVCSNFVPILKEETNVKSEGETVGAVARRLLPCLMKETSMVDKGNELRLNKDELEAYISQHALEFAVYFAKSYLRDPKRFQNYVYNYQEFLDEAAIPMQEASNRMYKKTAKVVETRGKSFMDTLAVLRKEFHMDTRSFVMDIVSDDVNCRMENNVLYVNSSASYINRFGDVGLRNIFKQMYQNTIKRYGMRVFVIPLTDDDVLIFSEAIRKWEEEVSQQEQAYNQRTQFTSHVKYRESKDAKYYYSKEYFDEHIYKEYDDEFLRLMGEDPAEYVENIKSKDGDWE